MLKNSKLHTIQKCPLFRGCTDAEMNHISESSTVLSVKQGDPVFVVNDDSKFVYIVMNGSINIVGQGNVKNQYFKIRTVKQYEHFAELSILAGDRHGTSAFARENSELLCIESAKYLEVIRKVHRLGINQIDILLGYYFQNVLFQTSLPVLSDPSEVRFDSAFLRLPPMKIAANKKAVPIKVESNILTVGFCVPLSTELIDSIQAQNPGYKIKFVLIDEPLFEGFRKQYLNFYSGQGKSTGTVTTLRPKTSETGIPEDSLEDLRQSTLLISQLPTAVFKQLVPHFEVMDLAEGEIVFSPAKRSDRFYFIGSGQVELQKNIEFLKVQTAYATADQYDSFFDTSLFLENDARITAITRSACRIFSISKAVFNELLKRQDFSVPFAITLAQLLNMLNKNRSVMELYSGANPLLNLQTQHLLPQTTLIKSKILPLEVVDKDLTLGMVVPKQELIDDAIEAYLRGFNVRMCLITEENFNAWTAEIRASTTLDHTVTVFKNSPDDDRVLKKPHADPIIALEQILEEAIESRASDIHFEPNERLLRVRYRIDGVILQLWDNIPAEVGQEMLRRCKLLAKMDITETRLPQDGQFKYQKGDREGSFRVSSVPTRFGEKIVLRATGRKNSVIPLQLLAPDTKITRFFNRLTKYQQGIFFITGPTGSGKSTTLYSVLSELNKPDRNIITIEDPIEANVTGINQIEINPSIGLTHEIILRNVLRQDPDVIMIGEIRDSVSMQLALDAALSGQLVLTTIHASNTLEVIPRIRELGGATSHIASGLIGVMSQRLVRTLCTHCKKPQAISSRELELFKEFKFPDGLTQVMCAVGCIKCNYTGFLGQIPVFEFWEKTGRVHNALMDENDSEAIAKAITESGLESMAAYGLKMVAQGLTTISEINDVLFGMSDLMAS